MAEKNATKPMHKIIKSVSKLFLNTTLHPYAYTLLNLIRCIEVVIFVLGTDLIDHLKRQVITNSSMQGVMAMFLSLQGILVVLIGLMLGLQKNTDRQNVYILEHQSYLVKMIQKSTAIFLLVYRKILSLPIFYVSYVTFSAGHQTPSTPQILTIMNIILALGIIHPLSGIIFVSKIAFFPNIISFPFKVSVESLIYLYLPIHVFISIYLPSIACVIGLVFSVFCIVIMSIRPVVTYRQNRISQAGVAGIISIICTKGVYGMLGIDTKTGSDIFLAISISIILAVVLLIYQMKRTKSILLSEQDNSIFSKIVLSSFKEILFYHIVNYENQHNSLLLYLIEYNERSKLKKFNSRKNEDSQSNIELKNNAKQGEAACQRVVQSIIEELKTNNLKSKELKRLFNEFLYNLYIVSYDPNVFIEENLGINELTDRLQHSADLSIIISQILMLEESNLRKCYTFTRLHQKLLKKIKSLGIIDCIEIYSAVFIIQEDMKIKRKITEDYNVKAEKYFAFEQIYEALKKNILDSCQNRMLFWAQHEQTQIDTEKLQIMIHKNFSLSKKIEYTCFKIFEQFPSKSPIILFELIASYSSQVLNKKIYSNLNPFHPLVKKYKSEMEFQTKQGALLIENSILKNYSLFQNIGVCMIDLEVKPGKIDWANQYFWMDFYLSFTESNKNEKQNEAKQQKNNEFILDMMVPELKYRHFQYFKEFSDSQNLSHEHELAFLYQNESKMIQKVSIQLQIFPSLTKGLKVTAFLLKSNLWEKENFTKSAVLIKDDFSIVGFTNEFICLKSVLTQSDMNSMDLKGGQCAYLCQEIIENEEFQEILKNSDANEETKKETEIRVDREAFFARLVGSYNLEDRSDPTSSKVPQQSTSTKRKLNKIYLLELNLVEQKKQETAQAKQDNSRNHLNTSPYDYGKYGFKEMNTFPGMMSTFNTFNFERSMSFAADVDKEVMKEDEEKDGKKDPIINMQKKYRTLMFSQKSSTIRCWMYFTFVIILILTSAMVANIFIFRQRKTLYDENKTNIKYYYQIIADISQILIALREYNYYVYMEGIDSPKLPSLIAKIQQEESQVNFKLKYVSKLMGERWQAIEISYDDRQQYYVQEQDFVVIANYMLSAMTYISQIAPQEMNFPIFLSEVYGRTITPTITNFNQAIYNGIYVVLANMSAKRDTVLTSILDTIRGFKNQFYVYPCLLGLFFLLFFFIVSIFIERKSENIRLKTVQLLGKINRSIKQEKLLKLIEFKENNCFSLTESSKMRKKQKQTTLNHQLSKNISSMVDPNKNPIYLSLFAQFANFQTLQAQIQTQNIQTDTDIDNDTKREIFGDDLHDLEQEKAKKVEPVKRGSQRQPQVKVVEENLNKHITLPKQNAQKFKLPFYVFVTLPSLIYFVLILVGGVKFESGMVSTFEVVAEIYTRKTNEQLALLMTRQVFYYEPLLTANPNIMQDTLADLENYLHHFRKLQQIIFDNQDLTNLQKTVQQLQHGNLCDQLGKLGKSQYYETKFTREECEAFASGLFLKGLKQTETWYYSTAMFILSNITDNSLLTIEERLKYLSMPEFLSMKVMLAYAQQFTNLMDQAFDVDFAQCTESYLTRNMIFSSLSILGLGLLLLAIKYRWRFVNKQRKEITSIIELVSLESIKSHPSLMKEFNEIEFQFYK